MVLINTNICIFRFVAIWALCATLSYSMKGAEREPSNPKVTLERVEAIRSDLKVNPGLKSLTISQKPEDRDALIPLIEVMAERLSRLTILGIELDEDEVKQIAAKIKKSPVRELNLAFNKFGTEAAIELIEALAENEESMLESLILRKVGLGDAGVIKLAEALSSSSFPKLKKLDLGMNNFSKNAAKELANSMGNIEELDLTYSPLVGLASYSNLFYFCRKILENSGKLSKLVLNDNGVGDESTYLLAPIIEQTSLKHLSLAREGGEWPSSITNKGFLRLMAAVKKSRSIESLNLKGNKHINDDIAADLLVTIENHLSLKSINLENTGISKETETKIHEALERKKEILKILEEMKMDIL